VGKQSFTLHGWRSWTTVEKHLDHGAREIPAMSLQDIVLSE